jgi:hypothetical protein
MPDPELLREWQPLDHTPAQLVGLTARAETGRDGEERPVRPRGAWSRGDQAAPGAAIDHRSSLTYFDRHPRCSETFARRRSLKEKKSATPASPDSVRSIRFQADKLTP